MTFDFTQVLKNLPFLLEGIKITLLLSLLSFNLAVAIGITVAIARLSSVRWLASLAGLYVNFFRSTPLFIQLVWFFFVLPIVTGVSFDAFTTGVIALGLYSGSFFAEVFRAGILAVPLGQREAALSQGMTSWQVTRRIVLPQAVWKTLPAAVNTTVTLVKDSSLVSIIAVTDLLYKGNNLATFTSRPLEVLTTVAVLYFVIVYPISLLGNRLHRQSLKWA